MKQNMHKTLRLLVTFCVAAFFCSRAAFADEASPPRSSPAPTPPPDLARRIGKITDAVLQHHSDPPARQQMILSANKALYKASGRTGSPGPRPSRLGGDDARSTRFFSRGNLAEVRAAKPDRSPGTRRSYAPGLTWRRFRTKAFLIPEKDRVVMEQSEGNRYVGIHIARLGHGKPGKAAS